MPKSPRSARRSRDQGVVRFLSPGLVALVRCSWLAGRADDLLLLDVAGVGGADEFRPVGKQHLTEGIGGEGAVGVRDAVEPGLADAFPIRLVRDVPVDHAEAQSAQAWKLSDNVGVRTGPM